MTPNDCPIATLHDLLSYDPETGVLTWRARPGYVGKRATWNTRYAGKPAGTPIVADPGYVMVRIAKRPYLAHRIAWAMMTGSWPDHEVDHKDGDPSNNRWDNLRAATHRQNIHNTRRSVNNTTGFKGVSFHRANNTYRAYITTDGKQTHLGYFPSAEAAHAAYVAAARRIRGEFARAA